MELKSYQVCMRHKTSAFKTNSQEILIIFSCTLQHNCYKTPERLLSKQPHFFFLLITQTNLLVHVQHSDHSSTNISPNMLFQHDNDRFLHKEILEGWERCK